MPARQRISQRRERGITNHRRRLIDHYQRIAHGLLHNQDFQQRLQELEEVRDGQGRALLEGARQTVTEGDSPSVPASAGAALDGICRAFHLPHDWHLFVWSAAVFQGARAFYPIAPSFQMAAVQEGPGAGMVIYLTARQMEWWNTGALDYALKAFKGIFGSETKPGRQPDYERAYELAREHARLGNWEQVYREQPVADTDPTAIRRQVHRFQRRGYR